MSLPSGRAHRRVRSWDLLRMRYLDRKCGIMTVTIRRLLMVGGAGERPAKSFLTSPGFALPDCSPPMERLCPPCLYVLKNSAQSPPRCTGDCPCALAVSASPAQRG